MYKLLSTTLCIVVLSACVRNPFFDDPSISNGTISGIIVLENGSNPADNIFVWLGGFNIGTTSSDDGSFQLELPSESEQGSGGGYDGKYPLYFYSENCVLDSIKVEFVAGNPVKDQLSINDDGVLRQPIILKQIFNITCSYSNNTFSAVLTADQNTRINCLKKTTNHVTYYSGLYICNHDYSIIRQIESAGFMIQTELIPHNTPLNVNIAVDISDIDLISGTYTFIPFIVLKRESVLPAGIINHFGSEAWEFSTGYLKLPYIREVETIEFD